MSLSTLNLQTRTREIKWRQWTTALSAPKKWMPIRHRIWIRGFALSVATFTMGSASLNGSGTCRLDARSVGIMDLRRYARMTFGRVHPCCLLRQGRRTRRSACWKWWINWKSQRKNGLPRKRSDLHTCVRTEMYSRKETGSKRKKISCDQHG